MIPALDIDPFCQAFFDDPGPTHAAMRDAGPVVYLPRYDIHAVARYDDVRAVLLDWRAYASARGVGLSDFAREKPWRLPSLLLETDPPVHDRTRALMDKVLSPAAVRALRDGFTRAAETLVDDLLARGSFDAIHDLAEAYPLTVFPDAVGMPAENRRFLLPYGNMVFNSFGPRNALFEAAVADAEPVLAWVQAQSRREALSTTGFGAAIHEAAERDGFTVAEAEILVRSLLTAGVDTTVNGLGAAIWCLARFPAEFERLRAEPSLARAAFEEAVRLESPVQTFFRTTMRDVVIGGETIPEGRKVLMFLGAANRDPRRWEQPDAYDITRRNAGHVGFGAGAHACVGAVLARLEGEAVLAALARKARAITITGTPRRRYNNTLRALASLPVTLLAA
ncbi:cytochrome P450 [Rhodopila globiformis]|uniref:Cytochrome P450 n=1 Tax=Rhodopila globiformis TaxID=1071 RepID=A0A2S6NB30_RHOGL|nr:cytochrome P450 [Rhodopila globiformis]PPQ31823.1 cytochrome P450 [Rhodopila globiformis]